MRKKLCAYDNGYGLVVSEYIGDSCHAMDRIAGDKFKVKTPDFNLDNWEKAWEEQKKLLNEMIEAYNEKYGLVKK